MIETSQLHTLVAVTLAQSFSKAAEDLNVTQSAISQSVKNLETKLGVKLFKRSGKKVVLTSEGEKLYSLASSFFGSLEDTLTEIQNSKDSMSGVVRIGTLIGIGKSWLAPKLLEFAKIHPELSTSLNLGFHEDLINDFENYRLDFLILPEGALPTVGEKLFLSEETVTLVYPKGNPFGITKELTLEELSKIPLVLFEKEDQLFNNWCRARFGKLPKSKNAKFTINSHGNMLHAVQEGLGVAVVPNHVLNRSFYRDQVETMGNEFQVEHGKFSIIYHKGADDLVRIQKTLEYLTSESNPFL